MRPARSRLLALVVVAVPLAACSLVGGDGAGASAAQRAGRDFLTRWAAGDTAGAAALTTDATAARAALEEATAALRVSRWQLAPGSLSKADDDGGRTLPFTATATLTSLGSWRYTGALPLAQRDKAWRVVWSPAVVHPRLTAQTRLARVRVLPPRAAILDRRGVALMTPQPVVEIGVEPRRVTAPTTYTALGRLLAVDGTALAKRAAGAKPDAFVPVITLRVPAYADLAGRLRALPGVVTRKGNRTLAATPTFGRAVLGRVGPPTPEALQNAGPTASAADEVGLSGLQAQFQKRLAGTPGGSVQLVDRASTSVVATLQEFEGKPGTPLRTTLDTATQAAAERAVAALRKPAALVALQPSTGEVLAVANAPADSAFDRAVAGRYPPGSTFKVVTSAALLAAGLAPTTPVACPQTVTVSGKAFKNVDSFVLGRVPFAQAFAKSCNTAFVGLAGSLPADALRTQATAFGLGSSYDVGVPAFTGSVPAVPGAVDRAAAAIGQGAVLASPLAMAGVAATVQAGAFRAPHLLAGAPPAPASGLPPAVRAQLQALMRGVVTGGSASVLASLPGPPVFAKTGTAEYGAATPPRTHAWTIGFRGDLAFAVLVEDGGLGGQVAAPVARAFLAAPS